MGKGTIYFLRFIFAISIMCLMRADKGFGQTDSTLFEYGKALFQFDEKDLYETTVNVFNSYLNQYPEGVNAAEVQCTIADLHMRRKKRDRAFVSYLKTIALYPGTSLVSRANEGAREAVSKDGSLTPIKEKLFSLIATPPEESDFAERYLALLQSLRDLIYPKLNDALIAECRLFLETYPDHSGAVRVAEWIGDMYRENNKHWEAVSAYYRIVHMVRGGDRIIPCQLKIADLLNERLKKYEMAAGLYENILRTESDSVASSEAQWKLARVFNDKLKNYSRAVQEYQNLVEKFPASPYGPEALMNKAEVQVSNLKQLEGGVETYRTVVERFPDNDLAPEALVKAGEVYERKMKDYVNAIQIYQEVSQKYPSNPLGPEYLFKAAELAEKKLKELDRALGIYQQVVDGYGTEKIGNRARDKIQLLKKKIQENERYPDS